MTAEPGPRALGLSRGAPYREEDQMPSGPVYGASHGDAYSFLLQQQDQEEVPDEEAEDSQRRDDPAPEVEMERSPVPDISPPSPPPPASATALADTPGPSYTAQHSPEYVHVSTRELAGVMDVVCSLASTQASMDQRLTRAETT